MLVIELGPQKPVVQLLGAVGEEEDGQKIEWRCRQDWQEHTHRVQTQAMQPSITKKILLTLMTFLSSFSLFSYLYEPPPLNIRRNDVPDCRNRMMEHHARP